MLKIYGSDFCPDCISCKEQLTEAGIEFTYLDLSESLMNLKEFLRLRDSSDEFIACKAEGWIGIPCIVREDGSVTLSWDEFLK